MKKNILTLLIAAFTLTASTSIAQDKKQVKTASKGFYSMKKQAAQLPANQQPVTETAISRKAPTVKKGYYSIGRNNEKLPAPTTLIAIGDISPVRKGFYSIQ